MSDIAGGRVDRLDRAVTAPTWSRLSEAPAVVLHRAHLVRTLSVALIVGTVLFVINQLDVVMAGDATTRTWVKAGTTYVVPFLVANYGVLTASRLPAPGR